MVPSGVKRGIRTAGRQLLDNRLVYFRLAKDPESVMLTFDDGPHAEYTPRILDLLDQYGARAAFFVIGERAEERPDLLREICRRGHVIGNHTYTHLNDGKGGRYSLSRYLADIRRCRQLVRSVTGVETTLFRPPRGEVNLKSLTASLWSRHRMIYWSLEGGEWGRRSDATAEEISEFVVQSIEPRDIVLLHDDNPKTLPVLEALLPRAAERRLDLRHNSLMAG